MSSFGQLRNQTNMLTRLGSSEQHVMTGWTKKISWMELKDYDYDTEHLIEYNKWSSINTKNNLIV